MASEKNRGAFSVIELLVSVALVAILGVLVFAGGKQLAERSRGATCISNLRQLAQLGLAWSVEHGGDLLPVVQYETKVGGSGPTWIDYLVNDGYLPKAQWTGLRGTIMSCPARDAAPQLFGPKLHYGLNFYPGFTNTAASFAHNPAASQPLKKLTRIERPQKTFFFGEVNAHYWLNTDGSRAANIYPHRDGSYLVFFDGHAEFYSGELTLKENAEDTAPFY